MVSPEKDRHADTIIRTHALFSMASGAIPIALADIAAVSAVQLDMIRNLCNVYEVDFSATRGKALVTAITSAALARVGAASLVKLVPFAGTLVGSVAGGVLAGASSVALGQAFKTHLSSGGTFLDLDTDRLKRIYREQFEKGKQTVKDWQREHAEAADKNEDSANPSSDSRFGFDEIVRKAKDKLAELTPEPDLAASPSSTSSNKSEAASDTSSSGNSSLADKLSELSKLRDRGLISEADFEATKSRLLGGM